MAYIDGRDFAGTTSANQHRVSPSANNSAKRRGCPRRYARADFHRFAKRRAFRGHGRTTLEQRRTLDRVIRCQRHRKSKRILRKHRGRYKHALAERRDAHTIGQMGNRGIGYVMLRDRGMVDQWPCLDALNNRESGWNHLARNPSSGAGGIPQALPASKMAAAGPDWATNPHTQLRWQIDLYIGPRYGSPCGAWAFWQAHHWY